MPISKRYRAGIQDLFLHNDENKPVLLQLAKNVTKSVCEITSEKEALDYIFAYMDDIHTLLNKRHLTKELLFKYLHSRVPTTSTDFTKSDLIKHIIRYWNKQTLPITDASETTTTSITTVNNSIKPKSIENVEVNFPINMFARKFSEWFFDNYNKNNLKIEDFWSDAELQLCTIATDDTNDHYCATAEEVLQALMSSKQQFGFYFNPNLTHAGVQGRMDPHGLVLVLTCGTLHTQETFVGIFECIFGVLRDPFAENNWKTKRLQCVLRSESAAHIPSLMASESLCQALTLPTPSDELS